MANTTSVSAILPWIATDLHIDRTHIQWTSAKPRVAGANAHVIDGEMFQRWLSGGGSLGDILSRTLTGTFAVSPTADAWRAVCGGGHVHGTREHGHKGDTQASKRLSRRLPTGDRDQVRRHGRPLRPAINSVEPGFVSEPSGSLTAMSTGEAHC
ncbi:hypothetical protein [Embleya sp. NPDC050493]|uniref:hypothetical protein n=1 Tax=Embleya sp. NPDC050493 TaxID=3363989 RepID=UPI003798CB4E